MGQIPPLASWPAFARAVEARLRQGESEYGDTSFGRPPEELAGEVAEELLDVCAWSYILWCRVRALEARLERRGGESAARHPPGRAPRAIYESTPAEDGRRNGG